MVKNKKLIIAALVGVSLTLLSRCTSTETAAIFGEAIRQVAGETQVGEQPLTQFEIDAGLREALQIGTNRLADQLGASGGFWNDGDIRIPLPEKLQTVRDGLNKVGLAAPFDDLHLRANTAAESAMPQIKTLFISAISQMSLQDAFGILNGGDGAATAYFREKTETQLKTAMMPYLEDALDNAAVFQTLDSLSSRYQLNLLVGDLKGDFTDHAAKFGLDGVFFYLEKEEAKIRQDPVARTSDILRRVFGSLDG